MSQLDSLITSTRARVEKASKLVAESTGVNLEYVSLVEDEKPKDYVDNTGLPYGQYPIAGDLIQRVEWNEDTQQWNDFGAPIPTKQYVDDRGTIGTDNKDVFSVRKGTSSQLQSQTVNDGELYYDTDEDRGVLGSIKRYLVGLRDTGKKVNDIPDLRNESVGFFETLFGATPIRYVLDADGNGQFAVYEYDSSDNSSSDNGLSVVVDGDGNRWKIKKNINIPTPTSGDAGKISRIKSDESGWESVTASEAGIATENYVDDKVSLFGIDVRFFGAVGDGSTSDSQACQDAHDYAFNNGFTNVIYPDDLTYLAKDIRVYSGQKVIVAGTIKNGGSSPSGSTTVESQSGIFHIWGNDINDRQKDIEITGGGTLIGLRPDADWSVQTGSFGDDCIQARYADNLQIHHIAIKDVGQDGIEVKQCIGTDIHHIDFDDICDAGVEDRGSVGTHVHDNQFYRVRDAVMSKANEALADTIFLKVEDNKMQCHSTAVLCTLARNSTVTRNEIKPLATPDGIDGADAVAIDFNNHPSAAHFLDEISGNSVFDNEIDGVTNNTAIRVLRPNTGTTSQNNCYDNTIKNCKNGIDWESTGKVSNNEFDTITGSGSTDFTIRCQDYTTGRSISVEDNRGKNTSKGITIDSFNVNCKNNTVGVSISLVGNCRFSKIIHNSAGSINAGTSDDVTIKYNYDIINKIGGDGNRVECEWNNVAKTAGGGQAISVDGNDWSVEHNNVNVTDATASTAAIIFNAGNTGGSCKHNQVTGDQAIANIRIYADGVDVESNETDGQSQGIRIDGGDCNVTKNKCINSTFQGIHLINTSSNCIVTMNRTSGNGTNQQDQGTGNQLYNNFVGGTFTP